MPNKKTAARAWAEWAAAQLGDTPPEPAPEPTQEQPEEPKAPFTALDAAAPYLPKTFTPPANDNRPTPLPGPELNPHLPRTAEDAWREFIEDRFRCF